MKRIGLVLCALLPLMTAVARPRSPLQETPLPTEWGLEGHAIAGRKGSGGLPPKKGPPVVVQQGVPAVPKVNGRLPRNSQYAGKVFPLEELPKELQAKYPKSVRFTEDGFADFAPYALKTVGISFSGDRKRDVVAANAAAGFKHTPTGYTWHHHQDGRTMQLVPTDLHRAISHTGGHATQKALESGE